MANNDEEIIKSIMKNNALDEYVAIEEDSLSPEDREEIISEEVSVKNGELTKHKKVDLVRLAYLYVQGYDTRTMANLFDTDIDVILKLKRSPKFKAVLTVLNNEIVSTARIFLTASGLKAVTTLLRCMDSCDDKIKLKASTEVLDRIGIKTPEQYEIVQKSGSLKDMNEENLIRLLKLGMGEILAQEEGENGEGQQ